MFLYSKIHLLFQLLIVALFVSIEHLLFMQYKTKTKKVRGFNNIFSWDNVFVILSIHKPSHDGIMWGPQKIDPIRSAFWLFFWLQTNKYPDKQRIYMINIISGGF